MPQAKTKRRGPRLAKENSKQVSAKPGEKTSKLDKLVAALRTPKGAGISDLMRVTGWQAHSVRGALAGALKKRGHTITSAKADGERLYRIERR